MCDWICFICIMDFFVFVLLLFILFINLHTTGMMLLPRTSFSVFSLKQEGISRGKIRTRLQPGPLFIYFPEAAWKIPKTTREYTAASILAANLLTFKTLRWAMLRIRIHHLDPYPPKITGEYTAASIWAANHLTFKTLRWAMLRIRIHNLNPYPLQMQHCSPFKKILYMNATLSLAASRQTPLHRKLAGISQLMSPFKFSSCVRSTQIALTQLWMSSSSGSGRNGAARISNNQFKINGWL